MDNVSMNYGTGYSTLHDNSGKVAAGGALGATTFATIKNSTKITKQVTRVINDSQALKAANKAKILKIFAGSKLMRNPIVQKIAGPLAGFCALSSVVGSAAKVADTCNYIAQA